MPGQDPLAATILENAIGFLREAPVTLDPGAFLGPQQHAQVPPLASAERDVGQSLVSLSLDAQFRYVLYNFP